jgi:hypothetical protein
MKKVTEFREIPRNFTELYDTEFRRNFNQFRTEYGIDGSKKNRRNSVFFYSVDTLILSHHGPIHYPLLHY